MLASTLSAPLAALLVLLRAPNVFATWPVICLEHIDSVYQSLALAALPALPGVRICWYRGLQEVLGNRYSSLGAFLTTWPNKLQSIENAIFSAYFDEIKHALPLCRWLTDVDVRVKHCMTLLPWLPPSASSLRSVSLVDSDALLRAILVAQKSLHHLTSLVVSARDSASVEHLMLH
ncbi:hypothetical protein SPRG_14722 [Saprolegnia parasitica CBS 223.65]|uniref:Secreted protein n=1 Tax=Saprolegnia parasitica (strain CBS 223.65) TaxID=695850 RepID=A0A067BXP6_SAPPC|nr:hypothetical protein SPRG_14722 [Saprolegnia parasitica CBS 223.65]KDO19086.1 hypothetical protein SPRG_14722 [Saprolegnia parasitica CBS 223.65]|eukprot:XP_012210213.1 hypothetical protein SPRG_14722 [Saprolegnia parasitica CBS 223.65]